MPGLLQPLRWPTHGRLNLVAEGRPRLAPLPIPTAPACSSSLGQESSHMADLRQHLQPFRHIAPQQPHGGQHSHFGITSEATSVALPDSQPADGNPTPQPMDAPGGRNTFGSPLGAPLIHTPAAQLQRSFADPLSAQMLATSPPITGRQHLRVSYFISHKRTTIIRGANQTSHSSSISDSFFSSKEPRQGDYNPGSV